MLPTSNLIDDLACVCDELALEIGDIYLFKADPNTALEPKELWILFQDWTPQGIRYESCTADFVITDNAKFCTPHITTFVLLRATRCVISAMARRCMKRRCIDGKDKHLPHGKRLPRAIFFFVATF